MHAANKILVPLKMIEKHFIFKPFFMFLIFTQCCSNYKFHKYVLRRNEIEIFEFAASSCTKLYR